MIDLPASLDALAILSSSLDAWIWLVPGLVIGLIFGAIPGISTSMAMALFLPMTLYMDFLPSIIFLTSIYTGGGFGGSVPAILMNIPGTPSALATTFDGYPMARKGLHNEALGIALSSSVFGTLMSYVVLFLLISPLAYLVLRMGPLEMFMIAIWGVMMLGSLSSRYVTRGLIAGAFGLLLGTVGMNTAGYMRGTMGIPWLIDGIPTIPAMIGLLAAGQLLSLVNTTFLVQDESKRNTSLTEIMRGWRLAFKHPVVIIRGSAIGAIIGAIPGVGSSISNLISYAETKRADEDSASFGTGNPKGVIAAESANSSSEGGAMATMLALGIPGGGATAILLAAFAMHNVVGGPSFIGNNKDIVYAIIFSNMAQAIIMLGVGLIFVYFAGYVVRVPLKFLIPTVLVLASLGSYAIDGSVSGPITLFVFSVVGWVLVRYEYPVAAVVVGLILGNIVETQFLRSWQVSGGDISYTLQRPGALLIGAVMIGSMILNGWTKRRKARKRHDMIQIPSIGPSPKP